MDAVQIIAAPVATDVGMGAINAMPAENSAVAGAGTTDSFGALLAMNMQGSTESASSAPSVEEVITRPETTVSTEIDLLLASQLAALQMNSPLLPTINAPQISDENTAGLSCSISSVDSPTDTASSVMEMVSDVESKTDGVRSEEFALGMSGAQSRSISTDTEKRALIVPEKTVQLEAALKLVEVVADSAVPEHVSVESQSKEAGTDLDTTGLKQQGIRLENKTSNDVSGQNPVVRPEDTATASEELKQADKGIQEVEKLQASIVAKQSGDVLRPERLAAPESQPVSQEATATVQKPTAPVVQQVRFAQPADVVVATSDTTGQEGFASNTEQQSTGFSSQMAKQGLFDDEAKPGVSSAESVTTQRTPEHQWLNLHMGQKSAETTAVGVAETSRSVVPEQIGRQVLERLTGHEVKQGSDQISFRLSPENLGNLQLNMRMEDQRLKLEIVAENREVKNALMQQADELKETLAKQNIRMDSFDVTMSSNGNQQQGRDWRQMGAEQRQHQPQQYASRMSGSSSNEFDAPVRYFAPQYQSTIDVRF